MSSFDSLTWAFEDWFDTPFQGLPSALQERARNEFLPPWDSISGNQRRSIALQLDYQHDPSAEKDREFWFDFFHRKRGLSEQIAEWASIPAPTAGDLAKKETRLKELHRDLARMDRLAKKEQGDYFPLKPASGDGAVAIQYIPYPKAISRLMCRLDATPEELAAWIWLGSDAGGLAAYLHANELNPPPRFGFSNGGDPDYVAALMPCWFQEKAVAEFKPGERFITGEALIERWSERPALKAVPFIQAKIKESRLTDLHPIYGATLGSFDEETDWPALATGLFALSQVEAIESEDFDGVDTAPRRGGRSSAKAADKSPPPRTLNAKPERFEDHLSIRLAARKLVTQELHRAWQVAYRKSKRASPDKSDVWHAGRISKLPIAKGRNAETIRKLMKL